MKSLLLILLCLIGIDIQAQSHIAIGTTWTYTEYDFGIHYPTTIEVVGDSVIGDEIWHILEGVGGCASNFKDYLIREEGDQVLMLAPFSNEEALLYDYAKTAGESWTIPIDEFVDYVIHVDSVGTMIIDGQEYEVQFIDNIEFGSVIVKGIGCTKYFFPQGNICDPHFGELRCFSADDVEVDFDSIHSCDAIIVPVATEEINPHSNLNIFPNPSNSLLQIEVGELENVEQINVYDASEKLVKKIAIPSGASNYNLDLSHHPSGIYFLKIISSNKETVRKIIKL